MGMREDLVEQSKTAKGEELAEIQELIGIWDKRYERAMLKADCESAVIRASGLFDGLYQAFEMCCHQSAEWNSISSGCHLVALQGERLGKMLKFLTKRDAIMTVFLCDDVEELTEKQVRAARKYLDKLNQWPNITSSKNRDAAEDSLDVSCPLPQDILAALKRNVM